MKKWLLPILSVMLSGGIALCPTEGYAETSGQISLTGYDTPDDNGIIYNVSGESKTYMAHYISTDATYFGINLKKCITPLEIVFGENDEVYIKDIVPSYSFETYVKGKKTEEGIVITLPQNVGEVKTGGTSSMIYCVNVAYRTQVMNEFDELTDTYVNVGEDGPHDVLFKIDSNGVYTMQLNGQNADNTDALPDYIIGIMGDSEPDALSWAGPGETFMQFEELKESATLMPEDIRPANYAYRTTDNIYGLCEVGFDGNEVFISGLCPLFPDACIKGILDGDKINFFFPQYIGISENKNFIYYYGEQKDGYEYSVIPQIVMNYDENEKHLYIDNPDHQLITAIRPANENDPISDKINTYLGLDMRYQNSDHIDREPQDPVIEYYDVYDAYLVGGFFNIQMPPFNVKGVLQNEEQLYYNIFINDELYTFEPENYSGFDEKMTDIPYLFGDQYNIYRFDAFRQIYINNIVIKKFGIQLHYRSSDGKLYSSNVVSVSTPFSSVEGIADLEEATVEYFTIDGIRVSNLEKGLYVRRSVTSDNKVVISKIFVP